MTMKATMMIIISHHIRTVGLIHIELERVDPIKLAYWRVGGHS